MNYSVYGFGGTGDSILAKAIAEKILGSTAQLYAADLTKAQGTCTGVKRYRFQGQHEDGSGRKRRLNYAVVRAEAEPLLSALPPTRINIIIHSLSGGSGSVIGPVIATEITKKNPNAIVIVLAVASQDSIGELSNSKETVESYEKASMGGVPILMQPFLNAPEGAKVDQNSVSRTEVDKNILASLRMLDMLFSGKINPPDQSDIISWANPLAFTRKDSMLSTLLYATGADGVRQIEAIDSMITLFSGSARPVVPLVPFHVYGDMSALSGSSAGDVIHFITSANATQRFYQHMCQLLETAQREAKAITQRSAIVTNFDDVL